MSEHIGRRGAHYDAGKRGRRQRRCGDDAADSAECAGLRRTAVAVRLHAADIRRVPPHEETLPVQRHHGALLR